MFCYQRSFGLPTAVVTREVFWALVRAPYTAELIDGFRTTGDASLKRKLPAFIFQATFDETTSKSGRVGRWRKQAATRLNGLCVMDVDHVENPREVFASWQLPEEVLLVYVTPSGKGLKVVFAADAAVGNLIDNQHRMARLLGVEVDESCKDASRMSFVCKESDILMINEEKLFTYENVEFGEKYNSQYHAGHSQPTIPGMSGAAFDKQDALRCGDGHAAGGDSVGNCREFSLSNSELRGAAFDKQNALRVNQGAAFDKQNALQPKDQPDGQSEGQSEVQPDGQSEVQPEVQQGLMYNGVPIQTIIEAWMEGRDLTNHRHDTLVELTSHLRYLIGNNPRKIEEVTGHLQWVKDLAAEGENVSGTIGSVCRDFRLKESIPKPMREALRKVGADSESFMLRNVGRFACQTPNQGSGGGAAFDKQNALQQNGCAALQEQNIYATLPLDKWAEELQEMAQTYPCMKELFLNVHPHKLPAILFSSAALFGTLMTRAWYHFWYEPEIIRRLNYCVFIIGDPGAGKNIVEKFYKKIADPMIQADQCLIDAVNRYKDSRTERTTSTKAQKGEALKRPVVGIRVHPARTATGEFIRHMQAAVENIQGQSLNLHMFSFDAELDNVTKNNKGGDWKDREILELKAFHNEQDGQMYANQESVTGMFNVFWNFIYTGTPYALHRKVNQRNFGTGMSTRLAVIPLPDKGMAQRHQQVDTSSNETLRTWAYRLDKVEGEIPIEPLNDETYDWQSAHLEIAEFNGDKADRTLLKRIPYYGIGVSLPFILMRHWDEWQESKSLTMDDTDRRLCRLSMEIQYRCQQFFFGEMAFNYFADQNKEFVQRRRTGRYEECFRKLPDEFKTQQFMDCFGLSQSAAQRSIARLLQDQLIERPRYGVYKKVLQELP